LVDSELEPTIPAIITILTDFGMADGYVAAMKAVILNVNPRVVLVDVTHEIPPQDVQSGAFVLNTVYRFFPPGTIHLAVVDPGVGSDRDAVIVDTGEALYVAPDNGLLSYLLADKREPAGYGIVPVDQAGTFRVEAPQKWRVVRIAEPRYWMPSPSRTFHGRDIFAPVAAYLSLGEPMERFGPGVDTIRSFEVPFARKAADGAIEGEVVHIDRFGNLITCVKSDDLPRGHVVFELGSYRIQGLSQTYADGHGLTALVGSSGYVEIALPGGSAAAMTGLGTGSTIRVEKVRIGLE
jgi:S-adenosyl-L-methionine hydrolase (adenosine-forming)